MSFCPKNNQNILDLPENIMDVLASFMSCEDLQNLSGTACDANKMSQPYLDGRIHKFVEVKILGVKYLDQGRPRCKILELYTEYWQNKTYFNCGKGKYEHYCSKLEEYYKVSSTNNGSVDFEDPNFLLNSNNMQRIADLVNHYRGIRSDRKAAAEKFYALMLEVRQDLLQYQQPTVVAEILDVPTKLNRWIRNALYRAMF
jgi:hypothetical protein